MAKTPAQVRSVIREGRAQNKPWHDRSKKNRAFHDGDSVSSGDKQKIKKRHQKVVVINIIKPAANLLIGMLAAPPMDFDAMPMVQTAKEAGKQATWGLKQIATMNDLELQKLMAGADAVIEGVGWYLSGAFVRDENPEVDPTQVVAIPARWVWFDLTAIDPGLRDAKWIGMSRWTPIEDAAGKWPRFADQLRGLRGQTVPIEGNTTYIEELYETGEPAAMPMPYLWGRDEWNDYDRASELDRRKDEIMIHELYYRDRETADFYRSADGHVHRYDPQTQIEKLFGDDVTGFFSAAAPVIRRARMAGPFVLDDISLGDDSYPLTPVFWDRDGNGAPYSFVETVSDPQEEVNARRHRAWWEVAGQRIQIEDDWLADHDNPEDIGELLEQVAKPDGVIKGSGIMPWPSDAGEHMAFVAMAKAEVREAGAVTETLAGEEVGKSPRSAESKRQSTVQAGMGFEIHRQLFAFSYKQLAKRLLRLMIQHHPEPWPVLVSDQTSGTDVLHLIDPDDIPYMLALVLGPASPTMKDKYIETIVNLLPKLPPDAQLQAEGMLAALEAMDMPGVEVLEKALRDYIERARQAQAMSGPPPPKQTVGISIPTDKLPPEIAMPIIEKAMGMDTGPAPPADLEPAPQGAHRPRQDRIGIRTAESATQG